MTIAICCHYVSQEENPFATRGLLTLPPTTMGIALGATFTIRITTGACPHPPGNLMQDVTERLCTLRTAVRLKSVRNVVGGSRMDECRQSRHIVSGNMTSISVYDGLITTLSN